jgi:hypothetical protein
MKTPLQKLLDHLKDNNIHIWDAEELLADEEDFLFGFVRAYYLTDCSWDAGVEELQKTEFYLNLSDYTDEQPT